MSVFRLVYVEDAESFASEPAKFKAIWLDERGNVVRQTGVDAQEACDYLSLTMNAVNWEMPHWMDAEVGPKYVRGGEHGPPYILSESHPD